MNSYDENLHATVVASLSNLETTQKKMKSKRDASIFRLYYSEGARINAGEGLDGANGKYVFQQKVKDQAVNNSNISINLLSSAGQQKKYTAQSVTNTAVCAANVQAASNAVVRLASDMGSIYSILSAADYESEIYQQSKTAYELMNNTAYDAERASQSAMEASTYIAEVTAATIADEAKVTNDSIAQLLTVTSADFDTISASVTADNAALASASAAEKVAEGVLEYVNVEYFATTKAYQLNNQELNQNLTVVPQTLTIGTDPNVHGYQVAFTYYKSPFTVKETNVHSTDEVAKTTTSFPYPVKEYYIMLVKDSKKTVFSITTAENLEDSQRFKVPAPRVGQTFIKQDLLISQLLDTDGDAMALGKKYVVFVMTVFMDDYKKTINNFDDFLSAPSPSFTLTNKLASPLPDTIKINKQDDYDVSVGFTVTENSKFLVEYRGIFLPDNKDLIKGLLSEKGLRSLEQEVEQLEKIADKYEPEIALLESEIATLNATLNALTAESGQAADLLKSAPKEEKDQHKQNISDKESKIAEIIKEIAKKTKQLISNQKALAQALRSIAPAKDIKPGFFFNLKVAEQVSPANYTVAKMINLTEIVGASYNNLTGTVDIDDSTTDNFGNPLIAGKLYVPVILSVSTTVEEDLQQYTSSLSEYHATHSFIYQPKK